MKKINWKFKSIKELEKLTPEPVFIGYLEALKDVLRLIDELGCKDRHGWIIAEELKERIEGKDKIIFVKNNMLDLIPIAKELKKEVQKR